MHQLFLLSISHSGQMSCTCLPSLMHPEKLSPPECVIKGKSKKDLYKCSKLLLHSPSSLFLLLICLRHNPDTGTQCPKPAKRKERKHTDKNFEESWKVQTKNFFSLANSKERETIVFQI